VVKPFRAVDVIQRHRPDEDRAVSEQLARERLLELHRLDRGEPHRASPPPQRAVHDEDLLGRHHHPRALPLPDGSQRNERAERDDRRSDQRKRPRQRRQHPAEAPEQDRPRQRAQEHDPVSPRLEADLFTRILEHVAPFVGMRRFPAGLRVRKGGHTPSMRETARRAFVAAMVVAAVVVTALALWKLKLLIVLLFFAFTLAAALRPSVDALHRRRIPRGVGVLLHYAAIVGLVGVLLWAVVPRAIDQVQDALGNAEDETGFKAEVLGWLDQRLERLPRVDELFDPALELTLLGFEIAIGIFFVLACAAYWIFERDAAVRLVTSLVPHQHRKVVRDTWDLIDLKLGAYVRGQALLILFVATVLAVCFWAIGLPFWLLIAVFAGVVEIVPVIGPLTAGALAVGVGLTESVGVGIAAGVIVLVVRLLEDYIVIPRVLGDAVGLSPLLVIVSVGATAILFGELAVLLAIPLAAVVATLFEVVVLERDPSEQDVPTVLFPAQDAETRSN
jgi:predicted PurR-regulated permease PerM